MKLQWLRRPESEPWILIGINLWALFLAELLGPDFSRAGFSYLFFALFLLLAGLRLVKEYHVYDPPMRLVIRATLGALAVLAAAHGFMFSLWLCGSPNSGAFMINNANYVLASLLIIVVGVELGLRDYTKLPTHILLVPTVIIFLFLGASVLFMAAPDLVDLALNKPMVYIYLAQVLMTGVFTYLEIGKIGRMMPVLRRFCRLLMISMACFCIYAATGLFLPDACHLDGWYEQLPIAVYVTSNAALSFMILALGQPMRLTGLFADVQKISEAEGKK